MSRQFSPSIRQIPKTDWRFPWPELATFKSWELPVGTVIVAADATVIYPNGTVETWTSIVNRRRAKEREAA